MRKARRPAAIAMALALALQLGTVVPAAAAGINSTAGYENGNSPLNLNLIARYASGQYNVDGGVMEIVAYSQSNGYAYAINGQSGLLAAIPLGDLTAGISVARLSGTDIDVKALVEAADSSFRYGDMTSVAISPDNTILAAALQAEGRRPGSPVRLQCRRLLDPEGTGGNRCAAGYGDLCRQQHRPHRRRGGASGGLRRRNR